MYNNLYMYNPNDYNDYRNDNETRDHSKILFLVLKLSPRNIFFCIRRIINR